MTTQSKRIREFAIKHIGHSYVYGAVGVSCTPAYRRLRQQQYPKFAEQIRKWCQVLTGKSETCMSCRWANKKAFDCAQLTRRAAESAGYKLPSGARSQFYNVPWAKKDVIAHLPPGQVAFLYNKKANGAVPHTGIACGDSTFIHARGHAEGVIRERMGAYPWTHFALLTGMEEGSQINPQEEKKEVFITIKILPGRRLMRGEHIKKMQIALKNQGYNVGAKGTDGVYGRQTEAAVKAYQAAHNLSVSDIVDEQLYNLITAQESAKKAYTVILKDIDEITKTELLQRFPAAEITLQEV